jgi:hypothetical protein
MNRKDLPEFAEPGRVAFSEPESRVCRKDLPAFIEPGRVGQGKKKVNK